MAHIINNGGGSSDAVVIIEEVNPDDFDARVNTQDGTTIWNDFYVDNHYENHGHIWMTGLTSPTAFQGSSVAFFQTSSPTLLWIADWTASKSGDKPSIPNPYPSSQDTQWVLLWQHVTPAMENLETDGVSSVWRISGRYIYGQKNPDPFAFGNMAWPRPPWLDDDVDRSVPGSLLTRKLIDRGEL